MRWSVVFIIVALTFPLFPNSAIAGAETAFIEPYLPLINVFGVAGIAVVLSIVSIRKP